MEDSKKHLQDLYVESLAAQRAGDKESAKAGYLEILNENPKEPEVLRQLATILATDNQIEQAAYYMKRAMQMEPNHGGAHCCYGALIGQLGDTKGYRHHTELALQVSPNMPAARWNLALDQLQCEEWEKGWENYEWGVAHRSRPLRTLFPQWDGKESLNGKKIWVWGEQGQGDVVQFSRYLKPLKERYPDAYIIFEVSDNLIWLMGHLGDECIAIPAEGATPYGWDPEVDRHVALLSLPYRLGLGGNIPPQTELSLSAGLVNGFKDNLPGDRKIGIAWQGSKTHGNDYQRSMPAEKVAELVGMVSNVTWYSLQIGEPAPCKGMYGMEDALKTWEHTAAAICALDAVVCVDTAIAHVAASCKKPVHLMLSMSHDWRWGRDRTDTVWYPSVTIYRAKQRSVWDDVIEDVAHALNVGAA